MKLLKSYVLETKRISSIDDYIYEAFRINQDYKPEIIKPKDKNELKQIIKERLKEDPNADLNDIDVSQITDMSKLFEDLDPHDIDISGWNMSNVINMKRMFFGCGNFNCNLSSWDVSSVKHMGSSFAHCTKFDCDLSKWDVSNVVAYYNTFENCKSLKPQNRPKFNK